MSRGFQLGHALFQLRDQFPCPVEDGALGRIDASRFATLFPAAPPVSSPARAALDRAIAALHTLYGADDQTFVVSVPAGGRIGRLVEKSLAGIGQAFGAAMLVDAVRAGRAEVSPQQLPITWLRGWL